MNSLLSRPFTGLTVGSQTTYHSGFKHRSGSILSNQTIVNGISKLTIKALLKQLCSSKQAILNILSFHHLSPDSPVTESELLLYLNKANAVLSQDYLQGLLKAINLNEE